MVLMVFDPLELYYFYLEHGIFILGFRDAKYISWSLFWGFSNLPSLAEFSSYRQNKRLSTDFSYWCMNDRYIYMETVWFILVELLNFYGFLQIYDILFFRFFRFSHFVVTARVMSLMGLIYMTIFLPMSSFAEKLYMDIRYNSL